MKVRRLVIDCVHVGDVVKLSVHAETDFDQHSVMKYIPAATFNESLPDALREISEAIKQAVKET